MGEKAPIVDSHFHIYDLQKFNYPWPTEDLDAICRNFELDDYEALVSKTPIDYAIFVQVLNHEAGETEWLLDLGKRSSVLKGIVAGLDPTDPNFDSHLSRFAPHPLVVGVRHILDVETDEWILKEEVQKGLQLIEQHHLVFDLLVRPKHLKNALTVVKQHPRLKFVVNHIAKPLIKDKIIDGWKEDITELARCQNVFCKISGLVVEADLENWKVDDFKPYTQHVISAFGADRCLFGSDWPVCRLAGADLHQVFDLAKELLSDLTEEDQEKIFGLNAIRIYNLDISAKSSGNISQSCTCH